MGLRFLPLLLLCVTAGYAIGQQLYYQFHQHSNPLCQSVQKLLNCSRNLEKYVKFDFYDYETFDNCTRTLLRYKYQRRGKEWLLKECAQQEDILFLTQFLHQYRYNFPLYGGVDDLLQLARRVSAKIRYLLRNIAIRYGVTKAIALRSVVRDASIPMAIAVDVIQFAMEMAGFEKKAKTFGAVGTTISVAVAGYSLAGVPGSAVGAGVGFFTWMAMEKMKNDELGEIGRFLKE